MATCIICGTKTTKGATHCPRCGCSVLSTANKYHNKKVKNSEGTFDSQFEYDRWCNLKLLQRIKRISDLERQVKFILIDKSEYGQQISYVADFVYTDADGHKVVEDTKSEATKTPLYRLKKRLLAERYGIVIKEITKKDLR